MIDFAGRTAFVTGGADGVGIGIVRNLLNEDPPFTAHQNDFASGAAWEPRVADPRGRSFALMVEYKFD